MIKNKIENHYQINIKMRIILKLGNLNFYHSQEADPFDFPGADPYRKKRIPGKPDNINYIVPFFTFEGAQVRPHPGFRSFLNFNYKTQPYHTPGQLPQQVTKTCCNTI